MLQELAPDEAWTLACSIVSSTLAPYVEKSQVVVGLWRHLWRSLRRSLDVSAHSNAPSSFAWSKAFYHGRAPVGMLRDGVGTSLAGRACPRQVTDVCDPCGPSHSRSGRAGRGCISDHAAPMSRAMSSPRHAPRARRAMTKTGRTLDEIQSLRDKSYHICMIINASEGTYRST